MANPKAIIKGDKYRFTVLTDRIIRMEYSEKGEFEDRSTQAIINRFLEVPEFKVCEDDEKLTIRTEHMLLSYIKK